MLLAMLGPPKARCLDRPVLVSLEALVPPGHFYRHLEASLDLSFVRDWVADRYSARGRPGIDPVIFFKLQLIMFFEDSRSERRLIETASLHLAHRWYLGYALDEPLPDHSSLTRIRERYGVALFRRFFEAITERCRAAGLLWGAEVYADATKVQANAAYTSMTPRFAVEAHLHHLFGAAGERAEAADVPQPELSGTDHAQPGPPDIRPATDEAQADLAAANQEHGDWITRCGRPHDRPERRADCWTADYCVSTTDPDATVLHLKNGGPRLGYQAHYLVDGGKARLILNVLVAPAEVKENEPFLDLFRQARFRWGLHPRLACGDSKYGTAEIIAALEGAGIRAYMPLPGPNARAGLYPKQAFTYDATADAYVCPQGERLARRQAVNAERIILYQAPAATCNACPCKAQCTDGQAGRQVRRQFDEDDLDRVRGYAGTAAYEKALRKRGVWVEPLFAEAKQWHGLQRFRLRGLERVNREALLIAAGQNLKRLLSWRGWGRRPWPCGAAGLRLEAAVPLAVA
jgi:transposase